MRLAPAEMAARLGARGFRLTRQRLAVLETLAQTEGALSALQLFDAGRARCPDLGLTTVYRTLDALSEVGAIRRVHAEGHCEAFVPAESDHGHCVVCLACGKVGEFTDCDVSSLVSRAAKETGFAIEEHFLQLNGVCAECQARPRQSGGAGAARARRDRATTVRGAKT
jgi:Fur family transcriptional regulator, ferric uptake regulator